MLEENAIADGHVAICRLGKNVNWQYVLEFLRSEYGQIQMLRHVSGSTGQTELLIDHVKNLLIPLPISEVQKQAVEVMKDAKDVYDPLIEESDQLRERATSALALGRQEMLRLLDQEADEASLTREEFFEVLRRVAKPSRPDEETSETSE